MRHEEHRPETESTPWDWNKVSRGLGRSAQVEFFQKLVQLVVRWLARWPTASRMSGVLHGTCQQIMPSRRNESRS